MLTSWGLAVQKSQANRNYSPGKPRQDKGLAVQKSQANRNHVLPHQGRPGGLAVQKSQANRNKGEVDVIFNPA